MPLKDRPARVMEDKLAFFKANGFWIEHAALSPAEVARILAGVETASVAPSSNLPLLEKTTALDVVAYHPTAYQLAQRILGDGILLSGFNYGNAAPNSKQPPADPYGDAPGDELALARNWVRTLVFL